MNKNKARKNIELLRVNKKQLQNAIYSLKSDFNKGLLTYNEYQSKLNKILNGYSLKKWILHYDNEIAKYEKVKHSVPLISKNLLIFTLLLLLLITPFIFFSEPGRNFINSLVVFETSESNQTPDTFTYDTYVSYNESDYKIKEPPVNIPIIEKIKFEFIKLLIPKKEFKFLIITPKGVILKPTINIRNKQKGELELIFNNKIKKISFNDLNTALDLELGIDEDTPLASFNSFSFYSPQKIYAIDPTKLDFTEATVSAVAQGTELYKCKNWNFNQQTCNGKWKKVMNIIPGVEYQFILTPDDPAFAEVLTQLCAAEDERDSE